MSDLIGLTRNWDNGLQSHHPRLLGAGGASVLGRGRVHVLVYSTLKACVSNIINIINNVLLI